MEANDFELGNAINAQPNILELSSLSSFFAVALQWTASSQMDSTVPETSVVASTWHGPWQDAHESGLTVRFAVVLADKKIEGPMVLPLLVSQNLCG